MLQRYLLTTKLIVFFKKKKFIREFSGFSFAAFCSFFTDIIFFIILNFIGINYLISQSIARLAGGVTSFYINRNLSFKSVNTNLYLQLKRFIILYFLSYGLSLTLIKFIHQDLNIGLLYAKFISDFFCFLFNFCVMKLYVYYYTKT